MNIPLEYSRGEVDSMATEPSEAEIDQSLIRDLRAYAMPGVAPMIRPIVAPLRPAGGAQAAVRAPIIFARPSLLTRRYMGKTEN